MNTTPPRKSTAPKLGGLIAVIVVIVVVLTNRSKLSNQPAPNPASQTPPQSTAPTPQRAPESNPHPSATAAAPIRIGSWNIEWLGKPDERSGRDQGIAQTPTDIADYIAFSKVSILALQEIVPDGPARAPRCSPLDAALKDLDQRTGAAWRYTLNPGRRDDDQLTGVAWNTKIVQPADPNPWRVPIKDGRTAKGVGLWNRPPHALKFSLGERLTDFVLIPLHMKADFQGAFADHREHEAAVLIAALDPVRRTMRDDDLILLGDTNMTASDEPAEKNFARAGFTDLNSDESSTHWRGGATDRIFIPSSQKEFKEAQFEVISDSYLDSRRWRPSDFKARLSDHYMVVVEFRSVSDDD